MVVTEYWRGFLHGALTGWGGTWVMVTLVLMFLAAASRCEKWSGRGE